MTERRAIRIEVSKGDRAFIVVSGIELAWQDRGSLFYGAGGNLQPSTTIKDIVNASVGELDKPSLVTARLNVELGPRPWHGDPAAICRANGWTVGTQLIGDEGYGPTVIEITALGEKKLVAKTVLRRGKPVKGSEAEEHSFTLSCRGWEVHQPAAGPAGPHMAEQILMGIMRDDDMYVAVDDGIIDGHRTFTADERDYLMSLRHPDDQRGR